MMVGEEEDVDCIPAKHINIAALHRRQQRLGRVTLCLFICLLLHTFWLPSSRSVKNNNILLTRATINCLAWLALLSEGSTV